jgi:hypothetical protein
LNLSERNPAAAVQTDPLPLQHEPLNQLATPHRPSADSAAGIDDPMPRDHGLVRQGVQSIPYLAGVTGKTGQRGYLAIGRDPTLGDSPYDRIDALIGHWHEGQTRRFIPAARRTTPATIATPPTQVGTAFFSSTVAFTSPTLSTSSFDEYLAPLNTMKAPMARRMIPMSESGRMMGSDPLEVGCAAAVAAARREMIQSRETQLEAR